MPPLKLIPGDYLFYKRSEDKYYFWYGKFSVEDPEEMVFKYSLEYTFGEIGSNCGFDPILTNDYYEVLGDFLKFRAQYPDPQPPVRKVRLCFDLSDLLGGVSSRHLLDTCHHISRAAKYVTLSNGLGYFPKKYLYKDLTLINNAFFLDLEVTNREILLDKIKSYLSPGGYDINMVTARYIKNKP